MAQSVGLTWDPNQESDLAGYMLSYGFSPGTYVVHRDVGNVTNATVQLPASAETYHFAVRAYNLAGLASGYSNEVPFELPENGSTNSDTEVRLDGVREDTEWPIRLDPLPLDTVHEALIADPPRHGRIRGEYPDWAYLPAPDFAGTDGFRILLFDGVGKVAKVRFSGAIEPVNDPPVAFDGYVDVEDGEGIPILLEARDVDSTVLTYRLGPEQIVGKLEGQSPHLYYRAPTGYVGQVEFTFEADDGELPSNTATVTIQVNPRNLPPIVEAVTLLTEPGVPVASRLIASDPEGGEVVFELSTDPEHGELSWDPPDFTYRPAAGYTGPDAFTYRVHDLEGKSTDATVTIRVLPANLPPRALDLEVTAVEGVSRLVVLTGSDPENAVLAFRVPELPQPDQWSGTPPNLVYLGPPGFAGELEFTFTVSDEFQESSPGTVRLKVLSAADGSPNLKVAIDPTGQPTLTWTALPGRVYEVQSRPSWNGDWTTEDEVPAPSDATTASWAIPRLETVGARFYRVVLWEP